MIRYVIPPVLLIVLVMGILEAGKTDEPPETSPEVLQSRIADHDTAALKWSIEKL